MSRRFAYWLLRFFACSALAVMVILVCMEGLARLAIDDGALPDDGAVSGTSGQGAWPADMAANGVVVLAGPGAAALLLSKEHGTAQIQGHRAPVVTARLIQDGHALITIDAAGNVRMSRVEAAWPIQRVAAGGSLRRVGKKVWASLGKLLAHLSLAALAHVHQLTFRDCDGCPEMVVVPAGRFVMGSPKSEEGRSSNEGPQHKVTITNPFAVGRFNVMRGEYARFVAATGYQGKNACYSESVAGEGDWSEREGRSWRSPGYAQQDDHPVVCIGWEDARAYAAWLSLKTGKEYRLLSEAEWEYAARAGSTTPFWWGTQISTDQANYNGNSTYGNGSKGEYRRKTLPVKSFYPNPWGLYQVHGNAWTWTQDCWNENYHDAPGDGKAWTKGDCSLRVVRGGSWYYIPRVLRAAYRSWGTPGIRYFSFGFRLARTLHP